jgi:hypothetical protein
MMNRLPEKIDSGDEGVTLPDLRKRAAQTAKSTTFFARHEERRKCSPLLDGAGVASMYVGITS